MPLDGTMGHSEYTPIKQEQFEKIMKVHLLIVDRIMSKHAGRVWLNDRYLYIDPYSGRGVCGRSLGSPLLFLENAVELGIKIEPVFNDVDLNTAKCLQCNVGEFLDIHGYNSNSLLVNIMDAPILLDNIARSRGTKKRFGMLYIDPNGIPCFDAISKFFDYPEFKSLDVLIYCPATSIKRSLKCNRTHQERRLDEELARINKTHWLIREPLGSFQWTFLLGTCWDAFPNFKKLFFHRLESPEGQEVFEKLCYTREEKNHLWIKKLQRGEVNG